MLANAHLAAFVDVFKGNFDITRAQQNQILLFFAEGLKWLFNIKPTVFC